MGTILYLLLNRNDDGETESFQDDSIKLFGVAPFIEGVLSSQEHLCWRIPTQSLPWFIRVYEKSVLIHSPRDWAFLWEKAERDAYLDSLEKFRELFRSDQAYLLPETLCQDLSYHLEKQQQESLSELTKRLCGEALPISQKILARVERHEAERMVYFSMNEEG